MLSAAVLAPAALACLWLGGGFWTALIAGAAGGLALEWAALCDLALRGRRGTLLLCVVILAVAELPSFLGGASLLAPVAAALGLYAATRRSDLAVGVIYVGLGGMALLWLRHDVAAGRANVLFVVLIVWASDIGAYVVGRLAGGPKLAPAISPGKTWSGAAGGLLAAIMVGWLVAGEALSARLVGVAGALGIASQAGDLFESAVKRHFGVKDSGRLIPGHGGLLDRLDGILAAAPAAALLALYLGRGVVLWR